MKNICLLVTAVTTIITASKSAQAEAGPDNPLNPCYLTLEVNAVDKFCESIGEKVINFKLKPYKEMKNAKLVGLHECFKNYSTVVRYTYFGTFFGSVYGNDNGHDGTITVDEDEFPALTCRFGKSN